MDDSSLASRRWLHRYLCFTAATTLLLICSGGMVTSKGVGLAVPDWPTTFGYNMFLFPVSKWVGGIFFEHTHRLVASTVGFLTVILTIWLWRVEPRKWVRWLGVAALGAVILQGVLGGLRVTLLKDQIGVFHACLAQAFFGLLVLLTLVTSTTWARTDRSLSHSVLPWMGALATLAIYCQLGLGATMRHQHRDLAILDFPTAYGQWLPDTSAAALVRINEARDAAALSDVSAGQVWLQMTHRMMAILIVVGVVAFWLRVRAERLEGASLRAISNLWVILLATQVTLGAWTVWSNKAADVATAHVATGALMLAVGVSVSALSSRSRRVSVRETTGMPEMAATGMRAF